MSFYVTILGRIFVLAARGESEANSGRSLIRNAKLDSVELHFRFLFLRVTIRVTVAENVVRWETTPTYFYTTLVCRASVKVSVMWWKDY